jgi:hypothetical protein
MAIIETTPAGDFHAVPMPNVPGRVVSVID